MSSVGYSSGPRGRMERARAESAAIQPMFESVVGGYGDGGDEATGIAFSMDGAVYSCGHTRLSQYSYSDEITLSQLAVGRPGWTATWEGGGLGARARDIAVASDGSIYVCGYAPTLISTAVLLKYSSAGDLLWQVEFRSEDWASGSALKVEIDASGNAYVLGQFRPLSSQDTFVAKVGPDGSRAWLVTYMPVDWQARVRRTGGSVRPSQWRVLRRRRPVRQLRRRPALHQGLRHATRGRRYAAVDPFLQRSRQNGSRFFGRGAMRQRRGLRGWFGGQSVQGHPSRPVQGGWDARAYPPSGHA